MDRRTSPMLFVALMALARLTAGSGAEPVKVSVYYETLCPDSQRFFSDQLFPVFQELGDIVTLDTNAYGKAVDFMLGGTYVFVCQHGTAECEGNMMVGCAKNLTTEEVFMAFTDCVMEEFTGPAAGPVCAEKQGIDFQPIQECYNSVKGEVMLHELGEKQKTFAPNLDYVPWIFINDVYTDMMQVEAEVNLKQVICETYKGDKPASCAGVGITRHDSTYLKAHAARLGMKNWRANQSG